jgi:hypothetical protein
MLSADEKKVFTLLLQYIEKSLVGKNQFNPYNCEKSIQLFEESKLDKYMESISDQYFKMTPGEFNFKTMYEFLKQDYNPGFGLHIFGNSGTLLAESIQKLDTQFSNYLKEGKKGTTRTELLKKHLEFSVKLYDFLHNEDLL